MDTAFHPGKYSPGLDVWKSSDDAEVFIQEDNVYGETHEEGMD